MCFTAKTRLMLKTVVLLGFVGTVMLLWAATGSTVAAQDPRPTLTPSPEPTPTQPVPTPAPTAQTQAAPGYTSPNLRGRVINVVTGEAVGNVVVVFTTGDVSVEVMTDENGEYAFDLGTANGVLNVVPSQQSGLKPLTPDVAVRSIVGVEIVVNLGVSPNGRGAPPLLPTVTVSADRVGVGENITVTVMVKNTLPYAISGAMVTDQLPDSLVPVGIRASTGNPYFSANLAVVELGRLDAGSGALVEIVAQVTSNRAVASVLQGKVSFFFREDLAAQAQALRSSTSTTPTVLPVTGMALPLLALAVLAVVVIAGWLRRRTGHSSPAN
jgi:uncharacterized repeat protein (TIGR01451 family)